MTGIVDADGEGLSVSLFVCFAGPPELGPETGPEAAEGDARSEPDPDLTVLPDCGIDGAAEDDARPGIVDDPVAGEPAGDADVEDGEVAYLFQAPPEVLRGPGLGVGGAVADAPAAQA
ncbi:MAG: hypothetical protein VX463_00035, partial [Pseudomonadota bacterium]|nr:hypothetical protein [Pseudomonadota bacterium]